MYHIILLLVCVLQALSDLIISRHVYSMCLSVCVSVCLFVRNFDAKYVGN